MKTCLIIEDSRLARKELAAMLKEGDWFTTIYQAENALIAKELIAQNKPQVLFLDIHLPGKNGFELLDELETVPKVIFTTAYDEYAIKSFDYNTIDYLLKPIRKERLALAVQKLNLEEEAIDQIFIRDGERCWFVKKQDIILIESIGNYSRLHFGKEKIMLQTSLSKLEENLDPKSFFRVNRQQMVNVKFIQTFHGLDKGKLSLVLKDGQNIEVSRRRSTELKERFKL